MVAGTDSCSCPECEVKCTGRFNGCTTVWAAGPKVIAPRHGRSDRTPVAGLRRASPDKLTATLTSVRNDPRRTAGSGRSSGLIRRWATTGERVEAADDATTLRGDVAGLLEVVSDQRQALAALAAENERIRSRVNELEALWTIDERGVLGHELPHSG